MEALLKELHHKNEKQKTTKLLACVWCSGYRNNRDKDADWIYL